MVLSRSEALFGRVPEYRSSDESESSAVLAATDFWVTIH